MQELHRYAEHYAILALIIAAGLGALLCFRGNQDVQQVIVWLTTALYVVWGIGHHWLRRDLTGTIMLEYFLVSLIGGFIIQSVLSLR